MGKLADYAVEAFVLPKMVPVGAVPTCRIRVIIDLTTSGSCTLLGTLVTVLGGVLVVLAVATATVVLIDDTCIVNLRNINNE